MQSKRPPRKTFEKVTKRPAGEPAKGERIAKVLARAGIASRREAERLIEAGHVTVNGEKLTSPALNVTGRDKVEVDGKPLAKREPTRVWRYHKPRGLVTTHKDPQGRPTVFSALPKDLPRVISVGRLDVNTEGLLLLTNDGELARHLELPATGWTRRYRVRAFGKVDQAALNNLQKGITVEGVRYGAIEATLDRQQGGNVWITMKLKEGKNREVKNVLGALGLTVNRLIRLSYGPFQLGDLKEGDVRPVPAKILREQLGTDADGFDIAEAKGTAEARADGDPAKKPFKPRGYKGKNPAAPSRGEKPLRAVKSGEGGKAERSGEPVRGEKPQRSERPARGEKPGRSGKPARDGKPARSGGAASKRSPGKSFGDKPAGGKSFGSKSPAGKRPASKPNAHHRRRP